LHHFEFFLSPLLLAASGADSIGDVFMSAYLCVVSLLLLLQFLSNSHKTWHTSSMCQCGKNCRTDF